MSKPPIPADRVARMQILVETTPLPLRAIAAECRCSPGTVGNYIRLLGWSRPENAPRLSRPQPGRPATDRADVATLAGECLQQLKGQLSALRRDHARRSTATFNSTLRVIAETTRTLKELVRVASALTPPEPSQEASSDDLDESEFSALCDDLARALVLWRDRGGGPLPPRDPHDAPGA